MIALEPFIENDFEQLIAWVKDEEALMQFAGPAYQFPLTEAQIEKSLAETNRQNYKIRYAPGDTIIGHAEILFADKTNALLCRILIGDETLRGKGLGLQVVNELLDIAFKRDGVEMASLHVFDWNPGAIQCYKKAGFTFNEGVIKTRQVKDQTWTALNMVIDKEKWPGKKQ